MSHKEVLSSDPSGEEACDCLTCRLVEALDAAAYPYVAAAIGAAIAEFAFADEYEDENRANIMSCAALLQTGAVLASRLSEKDEAELRKMVSDVAQSVFGEECYTNTLAEDPEDAMSTKLVTH